jgi:hypothetical protein
MRPPGFLRTALVLVLGLAPLPAAGGVLSTATLTLEMGVHGPLVFVGSGVSGSSSGPLYATLASGTGFSGALTATTPSYAAPPISGMIFSAGANAWGSFSGPVPSLVGGSMPVSVQVCVEAFGLCLFNLALPVGIAQTVTPPPVSGIAVTMHGSPWTAGTAAVAQLTAPTSTTFTVWTRMGSNGLNSNGVGTLVLVSAVNVLTNVSGQLPAFATLTLQYVPEPRTFAWVAPGIAALGLVAHRLRARRPGAE